MVTADWIALGAFVVLALLGAILGFGKGLKFFTSGIFGIVISVFVCYCFGGLIMGIPFIQSLLTNFAALWTGKDNFFLNIIEKIHPEIIIYYIVLFFAAQIIRIILVRLLKQVFEINFIVIKIINKVGGVILFLAMGTLLALFIYQVIYWIQGADGSFAEGLKGSLFRLNKLYEHNPLTWLVNYVKKG